MAGEVCPVRGWRILAVLPAALLLLTSVPAEAREYRLQMNSQFVIDVLPEGEFAALFGGNPDLPLDDAGVVALAEEIFIPLGEKPDPEEGLLECRGEPPEGDGCGEYRHGLLFAALRNPGISDITREEVDSIMAAAIPPLPESYRDGHFEIWYTSNNPDVRHNVTRAEIARLAGQLNAWWKTYRENFTVPKNVDGKIQVQVYYIDGETLGATGSGDNVISLNSLLAVKSPCKRRTTAAHELFHRVQYSYGYITGTANLMWIVEGTAAWSQKFTNARIRDYMQRMQTGLILPDRALFTERSYDAAHLWVYLQRRGGWRAVRNTWRKFQANGGDAKAALGAVVGGFDSFIRAWHRANYLKDTVQPGKRYSYAENGVTTTSCGITYGPLPKVTQAEYEVTRESRFKGPTGIKAYGADYHTFKLANNLKRLEIDVNGHGVDSYHFLAIKNNRLVGAKTVTSPKFTFLKTFEPDTFDKIVLMIVGDAAGGAYTAAIGENFESFIDFGVTNGLGVGTEVTIDFMNLGVIFSGKNGGPAYIVNAYLSTTSPILAGTQSGFRGPIEARFVHPATLTPITVTEAGARVVTGLDRVRTIRLTAFDSDGKPLASKITQEIGETPLVIQRNEGDIARVRFEEIAEEPAGWGIDHFVSTSIPLDAD